MAPIECVTSQAQQRVVAWMEDHAKWGKLGTEISSRGQSYRNSHNRGNLGRAMGQFPDPRCDELETMLSGLEPRQELVYRLALVGLSVHCRGDPRWKRRVAGLSQAMSAAELAEAFSEAETLEKRLLAESIGG